MKRSLVSFVASSVVACAFAGAPVIVENSVVMTQDSPTRKVTISYELSGSAGIPTVDIQTNRGDNVYVSIGVEHFTRVYGDVNKVVGTGTHKIFWQPQEDWPDMKVKPADGGVRAVVTAWALDFPPDYMIIDLDLPGTVNFYVSEAAVPGGVKTHECKTSKLVMRKIHAAGLAWREGSMTSESGRSSGEQIRLVTLSEDYYAGIYEVTQGQWKHYNSKLPNNCVSTGLDDSLEHPVSGVSWEDVRGVASTYDWPNVTTIDGTKFAGWLRGTVGNMLDFDLPTSAQWEYACRAGTTTAYNNGSNTNIDEVAWYMLNCTNEQGAAQTYSVGSKKGNAWGIYDMHGNIREWCLDRWISARTQDAVIDPVSEDLTKDGPQTTRTYRGSGYREPASSCRSAYWYGESSDKVHGNYGFRIFCPALIKVTTEE